MTKYSPEFLEIPSEASPIPVQETAAFSVAFKPSVLGAPAEAPKRDERTLEEAADVSSGFVAKEEAETERLLRDPKDVLLRLESLEQSNREVIARLEDKYGSVDAYLEKKCGIFAEERASLATTLTTR